MLVQVEYASFIHIVLHRAVLAQAYEVDDQRYYHDNGQPGFATPATSAGKRVRSQLDRYQRSLFLCARLRRSSRLSQPNATSSNVSSPNWIFFALNIMLGVVFLPRALSLLREIRRKRSAGEAIPEPLLHDPAES